MFKQISSDIYEGTFSDVPSGNGTAYITLMITASACPEDECVFRYAHSHATDVLIGSRAALLGYLQAMIDSQSELDNSLGGCIELYCAVEELLNKHPRVNYDYFNIEN